MDEIICQELYQTFVINNGRAPLPAEMREMYVEEICKRIDEAEARIRKIGAK